MVAGWPVRPVCRTRRASTSSSPAFDVLGVERASHGSGLPASRSVRTCQGRGARGIDLTASDAIGYLRLLITGSYVNQTTA